MAKPQDIQLPAGANPATAIAIGVPAKDKFTVRTMLAWWDASTEKTLEEHFKNDGKKQFELWIKYKEQKPTDALVDEAAFLESRRKAGEELEAFAKEGKLRIVLHSNRKVEKDDLTAQKEATLYGPGSERYAHAILDVRTRTVSDVIAQLNIMFPPFMKKAE